MDVEVKDLTPETSENEEEEEEIKTGSRKKLAKEHKDQLLSLKEKDPEFYEYLKEHGEDLLQFTDEDIEDDVATDTEGLDTEGDEEALVGDVTVKEEKPSANVISTEMVDKWCDSIRKSKKIDAVHSIMKAFRIACHYGDDEGDGSKLNIMSSSVFNKIMLFVLGEMDGIIRGMLRLPSYGGKKDTVIELMGTKRWKNYGHFAKSYFGNALHVLNQMTDTEMVSFTLRRLRYSSVLLAAFPSLLRKYIKVALHFFGTGGGLLPVVSLLFLRNICIQLGSDYLDECFKGIYKAYVLNCRFINATKLQHIQLLSNCVIELLRVDLPTAYQHAFVFIRQLAMILREAINTKATPNSKTTKTKEPSHRGQEKNKPYRKVYEWKFINCLELWTEAICAFSSEADFKPLAYPLTQIISGVARLVPTARYFPLRLRCVRMLNRIAAATHTYIPVSMLLLDMLEMKELHRPPTGGVGKAVDLRTTLKVNKHSLKTRAFQEECVFSVVEELAEHLSQWSYSVAFYELSFIPAVRLRSFCKTTKIERFRKEMRHLIRQIEANSQFINEKRKVATFLPNDPAAADFLEDKKKAGASPLAQYVKVLQQRARQRNDSLMESSVLVGEHSSIFGKKLPEDDEVGDAPVEEGAAIFSSSWLPGGQSKAKKSSKDDKKKKKKKGMEQQEHIGSDEDIVEDLVLSSDEDEEDESFSDFSAEEDDDNSIARNSKKRKLSKTRSKTSKKKDPASQSPGGPAKLPPAKRESKKSKTPTMSSKKNEKARSKNAKRRKRTN